MATHFLRKKQFELKFYTDGTDDRTVAVIVSCNLYIIALNWKDVDEIAVTSFEKKVKRLKMENAVIVQSW